MALDYCKCLQTYGTGAHATLCIATNVRADGRRQRVINKVETFDFTRYGYIEGTVQWVGNDAVNDTRLGPVYPVRIKLQAPQTPTAVNGRHGIVTPGMNVTADVRTDERRLMEYFLAPLLRKSQEVLRER